MLEKLQILELINILQELIEWIRERRDNNPVADKIQFTKTPSSLSESIAIHLLRERSILENENFEEINPGGRIADITARAGVDLKKTEIKATISDFQHFGINDINAHYLV
jgi:hypothetical protein